ncbi:Nif11-like leader peptide family natural product precursor [Synechococcus sp. CCY9201]|uniref:Nif11-like leader peptide family natural product precursor n=1 Tax=Synechococcus sp. CCY9201 TaxID=174697 RepID=UPI002B217E0C|nr:Nif11-like leader peptide family natural product precursor [Synechococcus sp. CCY9201]MEA5475962.1 Nif11-like leader peptide family natural product precursor [Synechococcus sp. CCY9201]
MSEEQLQAFIDAVKADSALRERLTAATADPDAVMAIATEAGFTVSKAAMQNLLAKGIELGDDDLEGVAGGGNCYGNHDQSNTLNIVIG